MKTLTNNPKLTNNQNLQITEVSQFIANQKNITMNLLLLLSAGFMMGLVGSPHCLGMCGGIVSAFGISMQSVSKQKRQWLVFVYHTGRIISYMVLGLLASTLGATLLAPLMNSQTPRILLGFAIIFVALLMLGLPALKHLEKLGLGLWQKLSPIRAKVFPLTSTPKALTAGVLWGLLPCGLVYGAIGVAISMGTTGGHNANPTQNILGGMLFMLAFGLGTTPTLIATQTVVGTLQRLIHKFSLRKASGVLMLISGLLVAIPAMTHNHAHHDHSHHDHSHHHHTQHNHSHHHH